MTQVHNSIVTAQEAEALKEMIFKRARERAEQMEKDLQENYTTSMQNDVMDIARNSFVSSKNPFSQIANTQDDSEKLENESNKIGFPQVKNPSLKVQADTRIKEADVEISASQIQDIMNDAYKNLNSKKTFIGALDFLNSQATIALINKKAKKFEALA